MKTQLSMFLWALRGAIQNVTLLTLEASSEVIVHGGFLQQLGLALPRLDRLRMGGCGITPESWEAIPLHVKHLECDMLSDVVPTLLPTSTPRPHLQSMKIEQLKFEQGFQLDTLMSYLNSAPLLQLLDLVSPDGQAQVYADCCARDVTPLATLHDIVSSGRLQMPGGLSITIIDYNSNDLTEFISKLPVMHATTGLELFCLNCEVIWEISAIVADRFPNLITFRYVGQQDVDSSDLHQLGLCSSLQHISLAACSQRHEYDSVSLLMLCTTLKDLQVLQLHRQLHPPAAAKNTAMIAALQQQLVAAGSHTQIIEYVDSIPLPQYDEW